VKGLPNGEDRVPTQRITVNVEKVYRGQAAKGQTLVLFQTGGGSTGFSEDDPAYQPGERYALLLVPGPNSMLRVISPEGRYRIASNGTVQPMPVADPNNAVVRDLRGGKPLAVLEQLITTP